MAFTDPQSITINGTAISLPRTSVQGNGSVYTAADGLVKLTASSSYGKRTRRVLRVDHSKITPDPFVPTQNAKVGASMYIVADHPQVGYTNTELLAIWQGLATLATASSNARIAQLLGGES